jgi:Alpha/beta hydrolase domain
MWRSAAVAAVIISVNVAAFAGQLPIPVQGQGRGAGGQEGRGGGGGTAGATTLPPAPVATPLPAVSAEVTGPGPFFETLMKIRSGVTTNQFMYETKEYFVSGTANGQPYKTRIVIRKPADPVRFSGLVLAESMHPSGNPWVFHFTHLYTMTSGHIGLEILTTTPVGLAQFNQARYSDLRIEQGQASDILAQVGALIKSKQSENPLGGLPVRRMILTGTSAPQAC